MSLYGQLSRTHRSEGVDDTESVAVAWGHGEHFQWSVGHETGVGVSELAFAVDKQALGVLAGVYGQSSWESKEEGFMNTV